MIKLGKNNFLLADTDGTETPFSAAELQGELIYCFLSAGLRDSSCFAEDIALAVEYSLHEKYDTNSRINIADLSAMVIETLENAGFYTVADWFKRRNSHQTEKLYPVTKTVLHDIAVQQGIIFDEDVEDKIFTHAEQTFRFMNAEKSPMSLIIEMLRFLHHQEKGNVKNTDKTQKKTFSGDYLVELKEVTDIFPDFLQQLLANEVLKINNITVYHPSIRLFLDCRKYAEFSNIEGMMTEMSWTPHASKLAQSMDSAIEAMQKIFENKCGSKRLPVYLTINNLENFMKQHFGVSDGNDRKLAKALAESFSSEMFYDLFRVRF